MLDVRRMKVLREVAASASFSAAAEALSFTQSAISQHVAALERETGQTLVERRPGGLRLTDAGRALVRHADAILARLDDAEHELAAIAGLRGGRLRLGTFPSAGATLVPRAVRSFNERHPDVDLSLVEAEPEGLVPLLRSGDLDLALLFDYEPVPDLPAGELERTHLFDDPLEAVLPRGHKLAGRRRLRIEDLAGEAWISGNSPGSCDRMLHHACRKAGFEPRVVFSCDDILTVQAFVATRIGVSLLPRLALSAVHPDVEVRPLVSPTPLRRVWAARPALGYRSPASEAMLAILVDVSADFAGDERPALAAAG